MNGEYAVPFPLPDGAFLLCDHRLDFLHQLNDISKYRLNEEPRLQCEQKDEKERKQYKRNARERQDGICQLKLLRVFCNKWYYIP